MNGPTPNERYNDAIDDACKIIAKAAEKARSPMVTAFCVELVIDLCNMKRRTNQRRPVS